MVNIPIEDRAEKLANLHTKTKDPLAVAMASHRLPPSPFKKRSETRPEAATFQDYKRQMQGGDSKAPPEGNSPRGTRP